MDNATAKANQFKTWQPSRRLEQWHEVMRALTKPVSDLMMAGLRPGQRVLDIASGVGEPAISIAEKVGPHRIRGRH